MTEKEKRNIDAEKDRERATKNQRSKQKTRI